MTADTVIATTVTATTAATATRGRRVRLLIAALLVGLIAPMIAVAAPAEAATVKPRTAYENSVQKSVLILINRQRHAHGLKSVRMNKRLKVAARRHNAAMSRANEMSHQLRGEADLGRRVDRVGYRWGAVAENIAWNSDMDRGGVLTLQTLMYNEQAPYDGHRRNILNGQYREVGIDVYVDRAHHKIWLTTDFGRKM